MMHYANETTGLLEDVLDTFVSQFFENFKIAATGGPNMHPHLSL